MKMIKKSGNEKLEQSDQLKGCMNLFKSLQICIFLAFGAISCDNVTSNDSHDLNQNQLQGKWIILNAYVIADGEYIKVYDTLELDKNKYSRMDYSNNYPCACLFRGTYTVKSGSIHFSGNEYIVDAGHRIMDSSASAFDWKVEFVDDSTLKIKGETEDEDQKITRLKD